MESPVCPSFLLAKKLVIISKVGGEDALFACQYHKRYLPGAQISLQIKYAHKKRKKKMRSGNHLNAKVFKVSLRAALPKPKTDSIFSSHYGQSRSVYRKNRLFSISLSRNRWFRYALLKETSGKSTFTGKVIFCGIAWWISVFGF